MIHANWKWTQDIEKEILNEIQGIPFPIAHICSASSGIGDIRIDRWFSLKYKDGRPNFGPPNIRADYQWLPIKSNTCNAVICDPPYDPKRVSKEIPIVINELVRILKVPGKLLWVCNWVPYHPAIKPERMFMRPMSKFPSYKMLCVMIKFQGLS